MTLAAEGAYIHLLATAWDSDPIGTLPDDLEKLRVLARAERLEWPTIWEQIADQFPVKGKRRVNERLQRESHAYRMRIASRSEAGKAGANARWKNKMDGKRMILPLAKNGSASALAFASATPPPVSHPQDPVITLSLTDENALRERAREAFQLFFKAYPKPIGEPAAWRAWTMLKATDLRIEIFTGLAQWKACPQWTQPQYIPNPAKFLEERRWADSPPKETTNGNARNGKHGGFSKETGRLLADPGKTYRKPTVVNVGHP